MSETKTPRERFVEAMQAVLKQNDAIRGATIYDLPKCVRQAAIAFADAECGDLYARHPEYSHGGVDARPDGSSLSWSKPHESCRAAIVKEIEFD